MQDLETKSLWSQVSGECISGPMEGSQLEQFPAIHSTYKDFKKTYPHGRLLKKPKKGETGSQYNSYFSDKSKLGIFDRADNFTRLNGKDKVIGLRLTDREVAVSNNYLSDRRFVLIPDTTTPVVLIFNSNGATVTAFLFNNVDTDYLKSLSVSNGVVSIAEGKMKWDANTGVALSEGLDDLKIKPAMTAFWFAWVSFFPETELIK